MADMGMIKKSKEDFTPTAKSGTDHVNPSLDDLIAAIDRETREISVPEPGKKELLDLTKVSTPLDKQFILFAMEDTQFAIPLSNALEVGHRPDITPLPNLPKWVLGISNIRGEIISLINFKAFLGIPSSGAKGEHGFIIIHNQKIKVGIIVDRVMGILSLDRLDGEIQNNPYRKGEIANYIQGAAVSGKNVTNIFDIDRLLSSSRMTDFKAD
jgi:purine-binding chemotaxis protein CheW